MRNEIISRMVGMAVGAALVIMGLTALAPRTATVYASETVTVHAN